MKAQDDQAFDLAAPGAVKSVSKRLLEDIDNYCATAYDSGHRDHLGASLIGHSCARYLWYTFRWCFHEVHSGRQQRLFNRGHREEARFVEWLKGIGAQVWTHETPDVYNERGEIVIEGSQYRISGVGGHFGGSLDGIAILPERYGISEPVLLEFKTNGTGAGFNKLASHGMAFAKPHHFAQTSTYGYKYDLKFAAYFNINKNDDNLYVELVKLDHRLGAQMEAKAERIITAQEPPPRLSNTPTYYECGWCAMKGICHNGDKPQKNCRSCSYATPAENSQWFCSLPAHNNIIPDDVKPVGCNEWNPITDVK